MRRKLWVPPLANSCRKDEEQHFRGAEGNRAKAPEESCVELLGWLQGLSLSHTHTCPHAWFGDYWNYVFCLSGFDVLVVMRMRWRNSRTWCTTSASQNLQSWLL